MTSRSDGPRKMRDILVSAAPAAVKHGWFEPRVIFRRRVGRQIIFPLGMGPALEKAVREGYLVLLEEKGGRTRRYAFTPAGLAYLRGR